MKYKDFKKTRYLKIELDNINKHLKEITYLSASNPTACLTSSSKSNASPVERVAQLRSKYTSLLERKQVKYLEKLIKVEEFLEEEEDPQIRLIIRLYFIEGYTWEEVASTMYCHRTLPKKKIDKYFKERNIS